MEKTEVPYVILLAANAYFLMRKTDALNHWTYIRQTCPEICTLHSTRLFPDDKLFVNILHFLHEKTSFETGSRVSYRELIGEMCSFVSSKAGFMYPHVAKLFKEERTPQSEGYKNIIDGLLSIRLGCVIDGDDVHNIRFKEHQTPALAIDV